MDRQLERLARFSFFVAAIALIGAVLIPVPSLDALEYINGTVIEIVDTKKGNSIRLDLMSKTGKLSILLANLSLKEIEDVRSLQSGSVIEVWCLNLWFSREPEAWQIIHRDEPILDYSDGRKEYVFTKRLFFGISGFCALVAVVLIMFCWHVKKRD